MCKGCAYVLENVFLQTSPEKTTVIAEATLCVPQIQIRIGYSYFIPSVIVKDSY